MYKSAIKKIEHLKGSIFDIDTVDALDAKNTLDVVIYGLNELLQYKELGSVEIVTKALAKSLFEHEELTQYKNLETSFDTLKIILEMNKAKKPIESRMQGFNSKYYCPRCEERLGQEHFSVGWCNCGQRLEV